MKHNRTSHQGRLSIKTGVNILANIVTSTLGPFGRTVVIQGPNGDPHPTKDGVTVAKHVELVDPVENIGAQMVKQAALQTAKKAGDGTTTTICLAQTLVVNGFERFTPQTNLVEVKRGMDEACKWVTSKLSDVATEVTSEDQIYNIAMLSANGDKEIGTLINEAVKHVGPQGIITVEESKSSTTELELIDGIQFNRGYKSPYFVTNNDNMSAVMNDAYILIVKDKLSSVKELVPILDFCSKGSKSLLIIADDIEGEALAVLVANKIRGILKVTAVKAPDFGDRRLHILEDIAILTGGQVVSKEKGMKLDKYDISWLGKARTATVTSEDTTIIGGEGNIDLIDERISDIQNQIKTSTSSFEKEKLNERLGSLTGGVAVLAIGSPTEIELKEKKDRVDDALHATKAAIAEGYIPGGGVTLLCISQLLLQHIESLPQNDAKMGWELVKKAIESPFIKILNNAGISSETLDLMINDTLNSIKIKGKKISGNLTDIRTNTSKDWKKSGIIDPVKVTRLALENAVSVAGTILTTEAVLYDDELTAYNDTFGM